MEIIHEYVNEMYGPGHLHIGDNTNSWNLMALGTFIKSWLNYYYIKY